MKGFIKIIDVRGQEHYLNIDYIISKKKVQIIEPFLFKSIRIVNYPLIQFTTSGSVGKVFGEITFTNSPFSLIRYF